VDVHVRAVLRHEPLSHLPHIVPARLAQQRLEDHRLHDGVIGIEALGFAPFPEALVETPRLVVEGSQGHARQRISRVEIAPRLERLDGPEGIAHDAAVIEAGNAVTLGNADAPGKGERPLQRLDGLTGSFEVQQVSGEPGVGQREVVIELDRLAIEVDRLRVAAQRPLGVAQAHRLQGIQRGGRGLDDRHVVPADRRHRLAQPLADVRGRLPEAGQHVLLAIDFHLVANQRGARLAPDALEPEDVTRAERRDGAGQQRLRAGALAGFERQRPGHRLAGRPPHEPKLLFQACIGHHREQRRLFQLDGQRQAERPVEHRVVRRVVEGDDHGPRLRGERLVPGTPHHHRGHGGHDQQAGRQDGGQAPQAPSATPGRRGGRSGGVAADWFWKDGSGRGGGGCGGRRGPGLGGDRSAIAGGRSEITRDGSGLARARRHGRLLGTVRGSRDAGTAGQGGRFRWLEPAHRHDEPIAALGDRLDVPGVLRLVTQRLPQLRHAAREARLQDVLAGPDGIEDLSLGQRPGGMPRQAHEQVHELRPQPDGRLATPHAREARPNQPVADDEVSSQRRGFRRVLCHKRLRGRRSAAL
jgi:hypothetical protein